LGRTTRFAYDAQGDVTTITDPAGTPRGFAHEPIFNRVTAITNPVTPPVPLPVFGTREEDIKIAPPPAIVDPDATVRSRFIVYAAIARARAATGV
jgi:hypothetical protein